MRKTNAKVAREPSTVAELAEAKGLPEKFLRDQGLEDVAGGGVSIPYFGLDGKELFRRTRGRPRGPRFKHPTEVPVQPYGLDRLADLNAEGVLHLAEGETDTLTLWLHGYDALGLPGSHTCNRLEADHLRGVSEVYVVPDNDHAGKAFVEGVVKRLGELSFAGRVQVVHLPDGVKDVNELHRRPGEFRDALEGLRRYASEAGVSNGRSHKGNGKGRPCPKSLRVTPFSKRRMRPTTWVVPDFVPRAGMTTIAGDGGHLKSVLTLHLAAALSTGRPAFGLAYDPPPPGRVLLVGCEDSSDATVLPRLAAAGADLTRVMDAEDLLDADGDRVPFTLSPSGIAALEAAVNELGDVLAVVIDPISAFVPEQIDDHKDSHVRRMLRPLAELAERTGVAIVLVRHLNKSDSGNAGNLVSGSRAYVNASRAAFVVGPDPAFGEEGDRRVLCFCKRNLTKRSRGLAYRGASLTREGQDAVLASPQAADLSAGEKELLRDQLFRVEWLGETDVTASDLARSRRGKDDGGRAGGKAERVEEAAAWLTELLKGGATMESDEVKSRAKAAGIGRNVLFEAKDHAGVRASNRGEFAGKWHWWLPPVTTKPVGEEGDHGADTPF